jgi:hypothetical protein
MSFARTALRIAAMEALRPWACVPTSGPYPTSAGPYVFDSRLDPIDELQIAEQRPIAIIYTEEDASDPATMSGPELYLRCVDLAIEIAVPASATLGPDEAFIEIATTDSALEFKLDLLECQILHALQFGPTGKTFRAIAELPAKEIRSLPHRSSEQLIRLAFRTVTLKVRLRRSDLVASNLYAPAEGLEVYPEPLRTVLKALPVDHYAVRIANGLQAAVPRMPLAHPLATTAMRVTMLPPYPPGTTPPLPAPPNMAGMLTELDKPGGPHPP